MALDQGSPVAHTARGREIGRERPPVAQPRDRLAQLWRRPTPPPYHQRLPMELPIPAPRPRRQASLSRVFRSGIPDRPFLTAGPDQECDDLHRLGLQLLHDLLEDRPLGWCLLVPVHQAFWGAMTLPRVSPEAALAAVVSVYEHQEATGLIAQATVAKAATINARFVRFLVAQHVSDIRRVDETLAGRFIWAKHLVDGDLASPSERTASNRCWATRRFFHELIRLGVVNCDPTAEISVQRGDGVSARPLTDREEHDGRKHSPRTRRDTRGPAAWALGRATAYSTEATLVEPADLFEEVGLVWLRGGHGRAPRWGHLEDWDIASLLNRIDYLGVRRDEPVSLIYEGDGSDDSRQASGSDALYEIFQRAGYGSDRAVKPSSLPAWAGRKVFELCRDLDEVRHRLGVTSLDRTLSIIGAPHGCSDLPPAHRCCY